jgi:hypothetical protein
MQQRLSSPACGSLVPLSVLSPVLLFFFSFFFYFILSPRMQQSVWGHSAAMLAGNDSDMQGIHPVMYLL